jgi:hypothetical protein
MEPWNDSRLTCALPPPSVKLKRLPLRVSVRVTGKAEANSPLKVDTEIAALAPGGTDSVMSPLWVEKV